MNLFVHFINILVAGAVILSTLRMYLQVNKLWSRKHEKVVAESISIAANTLGMCVHLPFFFRFTLIDNNIPAAINSVVIFSGLSMMSIIGTGLWVRANKNDSFFTLLKNALWLEKKESGDLIKELVRPSGVKYILDILQKLACIDKVVQENEIQLIEKHAKEWGIDDIGLKAGPVENVVTLSDLRESMVNYLNISPPAEQVQALGDLMKVLIKADGVISDEEELILKELRGLMNNYILDEGDLHPRYQVLVVPQDKSQYTAIQELLPKSQLEERRGGKAFCAGHFYSQEYAEAMCNKYMILGLFSTVEDTSTTTIDVEI